MADASPDLYSKIGVFGDGGFAEYLSGEDVRRDEALNDRILRLAFRLEAAASHMNQIEAMLIAARLRIERF